jgi:catechol 2,3-dioxygenase-like lactoylglutathione lyase family enzyme
VDFYTRVLRLEVGARPEIPAPGAWLYAGGQPIVHLYAHLAHAAPVHELATGPLDHISFRARGLTERRAHLASHGIAFTEAPIPGWDIHQLFVHDPHGLKIEMTFWSKDEGEDEGARR